MKDFKLVFSHPWFLLAFVLVLLASLIPHFMIRKKYRRNRTRITSLVLHLVVSALTVLTLAGLTFTYSINNDHNEILLLVDVSDTIEDKADERDEFIQRVLDYGQYDGYKIGIVTFGFDQVYAVPLTKNVKSIYNEYLRADSPDTSASDIAAALNYAKTLLKYPETSKIVLVSDLKETDEKANNVIRAISASGIKIDIASLDTVFKGKDNQITNVSLPETHISVGEDCLLGFTVVATDANEFTASLYDNDVLVTTESYSALPGTNEYTITHNFAEEGRHELKVEINSPIDQVSTNNTCVAFANIQTFKHVLIIDGFEGNSDSLKEILMTNDMFECDVLTINSDALPDTVDALREYDQVILNNVSNSQLTTEFSNALYSYVKEYGGGLLTVGGDKEDDTANTYNRKDMYGSTLQEMLPVEAINYTPPVGVVFIIDKSGSMSMKDSSGRSYLEMAELGALSALDSLSERDYVGIMTLESTYGLVLEMTPRTQDGKIRAAIDSIGTKTTGGTVFYDPIERAAQQLNACSNVTKRHIILISDGIPADQTSDETGNKVYQDLIQKIYEQNGITTSIIILGKDSNSSAAAEMAKAAEMGHGYVYALKDASDISSSLREDLSAPEIREENDISFNPTIKDIFSPVVTGVSYSTEKDTQNQMFITLEGFYGVKVKNQAKLIIAGDYSVPIYAQWKYGKGMVGSLMIDLYGKYSSEFINDSDGKRVVQNVVRTLMPTEEIRPSEITLSITGENYLNNLCVYTKLNEGETISGSISYISGDSDEVKLTELPTLSSEELRSSSMYMMTVLSAENNYSRCSFVARNAGVYMITVNKVNATGEIIATTTKYITFSYSKEYDLYMEALDKEELASKGKGTVISDNEDPVEVFDGFVTSFNKEFDPRILFMIIALVCFLTDIAVRKFKFKWIHEMVHDYRTKKNK